MSTENVARLLETYEAFVEGKLERIPELFDPDGFYRSSGVFPGMQEIYRGYDGIEALWHAAYEPWEHFEIEARRTVADGDCVVAAVRFRGRGAGSGVEVTNEAGHLVRFRDGLIVEFSAFASWDDALAASDRCLALAAEADR